MTQHPRPKPKRSRRPRRRRRVTQRERYARTAQRWADFAASAVRIRPSTIPGAGLGVFVLRDVKRYQTLAAYAGVRIDRHTHEDTDYVMCDRDARDPGGWVDAEGVYHGVHANWTRFVNDPRNERRVNVKVVSNAKKWGKPLVFMARRDLKAGEELFIDYGDTYWDERACTALA